MNLFFIYDWIYDFYVLLVSWLFEGLLYIYFKIMHFLLQVFWQMAQDILASYQIMEKLDFILSAIDPSLSNAAQFFRLKECVHLLASAQITRYLFSFIPFA